MLFGRGDFEIAAYVAPENVIECVRRASLFLLLVLEHAYETITLFLCRYVSDVDCRCLGRADYFRLEAKELTAEEAIEIVAIEMMRDL